MQKLSILSHEDVAYIFTNANKTGNGVLVDNTFLTAAHVVEPSDIFSAIGEEFSSKSMLFYENNDYWYKKVLRILSFNKCGWNFDDFAMYETKSKSSYSLSHNLPLVDEILETYSIREEIEQQSTEECHNVFASLNNRHLVMHIDIARVLYVRGNYIFCEMNGMLEKGRSGCPLIKDNKIYGILRGGDDKKICWFQSSVSILKRFHEQGFSIVHGE